MDLPGHAELSILRKLDLRLAACWISVLYQCRISIKAILQLMFLFEHPSKKTCFQVADPKGSFRDASRSWRA